MKGICHIWSRGRHFSPSLPGERYLKLSSQKRSTGRNLGEHRSVRRSGTASRGTALLVFCLRMRSFPRTEVPTIFVGKKYPNRVNKMQAVVHGVYPCRFTSSWAYARSLRLGIRNNTVHCLLDSCFNASFFFFFSLYQTYSRIDDKQKPVCRMNVILNRLCRPVASRQPGV